MLIHLPLKEAQINCTRPVLGTGATFYGVKAVVRYVSVFIEVIKKD